MVRVEVGLWSNRVAALGCWSGVEERFAHGAQPISGPYEGLQVEVWAGRDIKTMTEGRSKG